ncbi:type II and III secretion system protein family protein [Vibrio agarivorans]|uniref:Pilus assembly protein N-terminal domain-containing protein n=1 Tax=Vibrio agarivorans TaxID=153622 RepID=A0ABT7Y6P4_9VIBR|nr:pilus assembly protein N-terminal domain-containing protein [Vibrio agarivorans]MDN2483731.1 pilus assembly protein N-terminal domain-containing protein [Vibrio agarivorans]
MIRWFTALCVGVLSVALTVPASAQRLLNIMEGEAKSLFTSQDIGSVFIANPAIADYQVMDKNRVIVFGKATGSTSLLVFDENNKTILSRKVITNKSYDHILQTVKLHYPNSDVAMYNLGDQIVLSGTVATEAEKDGINSLVGDLLARGTSEKTVSIGGEGGDSDNTLEFMTKKDFQGVINRIEVAVTKQVNVKLSIAEVSHSFLENFGIQYGDAALGAGMFVNPILDFSADNILAVITAMGDDSVGQVLAEPNMSVISGESASFLVGGEIPVVTVVDGGTNIEYKEFGVRLDLVAKVLRDDKIMLSLAPEVSSLDSQYTSGQYSLPALKTRRAQTTVELGDGQSFVLGGLLSSEDMESLRKVPYASDVPVLGSMFRHTETSRSKTELIIVATVNLVKPIHSSQIQLPTIRKTTNLQRFFALDSQYSTATQQWAQEILSSGGFKK